MFKKIMWITLIISFLTPIFSSAAGLVPCGTREYPTMCTTCDFLALIQNILTLVFKYSFVVGAIFIMIAGFSMMFAQGHEGKVKLAWKSITNVIIGIVILLSSWLIVNTLLYYLVDVNDAAGAKLKNNWYHLECHPDTTQAP